MIQETELIIHWLRNSLEVSHLITTTHSSSRVSTLSYVMRLVLAAAYFLTMQSFLCCQLNVAFSRRSTLTNPFQMITSVHSWCPYPTLLFKNLHSTSYLLACYITHLFLNNLSTPGSWCLLFAWHIFSIHLLSTWVCIFKVCVSERHSFSPFCQFLLFIGKFVIKS